MTIALIAVVVATLAQAFAGARLRKVAPSRQHWSVNCYALALVAWFVACATLITGVQLGFLSTFFGISAAASCVSACLWIWLGRRMAEWDV